jgi:hypothetical protein
MRQCIVVLLVGALMTLAAGASAAPTFFDNFEGGFNGTAWPTWPTANDHLNSSNNRSHAGGTLSVRQDPEDPATLANYHDFGATAGAVDASVWVWDDNSSQGTASAPVNFYFGLYGDSASPTDDTDHLLLGLSPTFADLNTYGYKSKLNGSGNTGFTRTAAITGSVDHSGWFLLDVQADALSDGGQVRFYINGNQVGTASREPGVDLRYLFMGSQSKNYEFFWYDDVSITTPEPSAATLCLLAGPLLLRRRAKACHA